MQHILFDPSWKNSLLPLAYTRPVAAFRVGILTIREKWEHLLEASCSHLVDDYLSKKFPLNTEAENLMINGSVCPSEEMAAQIAELGQNGSLWKDDLLIAAKTDDLNAQQFSPAIVDKDASVQYVGPDFTVIRHLWDIFRYAGFEIDNDLRHVMKLRSIDELDKTNTIIGDQFYIDPTAEIAGATLNASTGPIYIGPDAEVMEGAMIRGPFALGDHSTVKMGAKIYGPTSIGPWCKVGGEVNNAVFFGYSNKAHDGFLGNAVIGEWCNLGADTNNSNLKNNYAEVKLWNYELEHFENTGLQFCGLIMADHSKTGINTMLNTGTVIGVSANIYGSGFPRNFIPSFSWGGASKMTTYKLERAFKVCEAVMKRREVDFSDMDKEILSHIFDASTKYRKS